MSFDDDAKTWDNDPSKAERASALAGEIRTFLKPDGSGTALEFGCGTGLLSFFLKDDFKKISLADTSAGMIEVLKEKIADQNIANFLPLQIDLFKEDLRPAQFDTIYTLMTLHHVKDIAGILRIFHSLVKPGGTICIADLDKEDGSFHAKHPDFDGHKGFDRKELESKLKAAGFQAEYYSIFYTIERETAEGTKRYPLFLMVGKRER
jgi:2-polyprenyl-3-methyl-5-hydroxy-6-metoxy-1,4-benzoquinol methylase